MHDAYRYQVREVDYNFDSINPFKGAPIEDIEKEWTYLMNGGKEASSTNFFYALIRTATLLDSKLM